MIQNGFQDSLFYQHKNDNNNNNFIDIDLDCPIKKNIYVIVSNTTENQHRNVEIQISSSKDVEKLLNHVHWRMFISSCTQACYNFTYSTYEFENVCSNSSCCFSDSIDDLFFSSIQCGDKCSKTINSFAIRTWYLLSILGLICLIGNFIVIYDKLINFQTKQDKCKEVQIYHALVLNLALSDLLMGVYLTAISFEIKHKATRGVLFSEPGICNALGIINIVSSQVSITTLFLISIYRLISVIRPYKQHHFRLLVELIILSWIMWLVVASFPFMPLETLKTAFTMGLSNNRRTNRDFFIDFTQVVSIAQSHILPSYNNVTEVKSILYAVTQFSTPSVMEKFSTALGWIDLNSKFWNLIGYYQYQYTCSPNYLIFDNSSRSAYFSLALVFCNLIVSVAILISYVLVTFTLYEKNKFRFVFCKCCMSICSCKKILRNNDFEEAKIRSAENQKIFRRITLILLTDILFWIPLCLISLVVWTIASTVQDPKDLVENVIFFKITLLVLVSFNSILNPYIYSCPLWSKIFERIKSKFSKT